jgi:Domain of unknown function (DUF4157)/Lysine-specific metallo-endopeptidase
MSASTLVRERKIRPAAPTTHGSLLQRSAINRRLSTPAAPLVQVALRSPGQPLDFSARTFLETRLSRDFSRVRVHTDAKSAESAQAVNALAYTVGDQIVFGAGQYAPATPAGQRLLAHELTHVLQQETAAMGIPVRVDPVDSPAEAEAETVAQQVMSIRENPLGGGLPVSVHPGSAQVNRTPVFGPSCQGAYDRCRVIEPLQAANQLIDRALAELPPLAAGTVTQGRIVDLLNVHFHDPSNVAGRAATVLANYGAIKTELNSSLPFRCHPPDQECQSSQGAEGAFTGDQPGGEISLCEGYMESNCAEQARMLIHEVCHHIVATRIDHAYVFQPQYDSLTAAQAGENPDTYAQFAKMVFMGTPACKDCSTEAQLRPAQYEEQKGKKK